MVQVDSSPSCLEACKPKSSSALVGFRVYRGYVGIMENKMETIIWGLGFIVAAGQTSGEYVEQHNTPPDKGPLIPFQMLSTTL